MSCLHLHANLSERKTQKEFSTTRKILCNSSYELLTQQLAVNSATASGTGTTKSSSNNFTGINYVIVDWRQLGVVSPVKDQGKKFLIKSYNLKWFE